MALSAELLSVNLYTGLASPLIGSAIAAGTARWIAGKSWGFEASCCPACGRRLRALEMVPIVSWAALGGACRGCAAPISPHYPLVELAAVGVALWAWLATPPQVFAVTCVFGWLLLALSVIDIRTRRLPDPLNLALAATGLVAAAFLAPERILDHAAGCVVGFASLVAIEIAYRKLRGRDGIGRGDAKLLAAIGAWIGILGLAECIFVASASGIAWLLLLRNLTGRQISSDTAVSFGPFLALGGWLTWLYGPLAF